jgi:hypothetical protein
MVYSPHRAVKIGLSGCGSPLLERERVRQGDDPVTHKLRPVIEGDWRIGPNPVNLGPDLQAAIVPGRFRAGQEVVDHHIWRDARGAWRLWACIRYTAVGRLFAGWVSDDLERSDWECLGAVMRRDKNAGESLADHGDRLAGEVLQSPFVIRSITRSIPSASPPRTTASRLRATATGSASRSCSTARAPRATHASSGLTGSGTCTTPAARPASASPTRSSSARQRTSLGGRARARSAGAGASAPTEAAPNARTS